MTEQLHFHFSVSCIGEGNGNPLQCSCLEKNPRDGGAWWAAVYGVAQSRTRLKRLSSRRAKVQPRQPESPLLTTSLSSWGGHLCPRLMKSETHYSPIFDKYLKISFIATQVTFSCS